MGNRLTQIVTRTGDDGTTGLGNNQRVSKSHMRVQTMGDVDELNSHIGLLMCEPLAASEHKLLLKIQHDLFNLGGEVSIPGYELLKAQAVEELDVAIAKYNQTLPKLEEFILPGGSRASALAHICRTVARRAERSMVALGETESVNEAPRLYLNRLSDLLFILARVFNQAFDKEDVYWNSARMSKHEK
jgi:cob(I)alamin adenosyltransferase